ncbi:orotidine-5'-phosphate decarboxylase [candidate division NPL-UPA2 bacterium]|nr:orotidine-5'-phosphate decarboxylase [candidate division NPL-UPA2 bacterium]
MALTAKDRLVLALDVDEGETALDLVERLEKYVDVFKVGVQLLTREGPEIIRRIQERGKKVFYDAKYHDIPTTVAKAGRMAVRLGVYIYNIHTLGGYEMMKGTVQATRKEAEELGVEKPLVFGVTILTHIEQGMLKEVGIEKWLKDEVVHLAKLARRARLDGVVSSPEEIGLIREACGDDFLILTPGIRPLWAEGNDQRRRMTPGEAIKAGADFIVIGRPILQAREPVEAAQRILREMEEAIAERKQAGRKQAERKQAE